MSKRPKWFRKGDSIEAAYAQRANGPGWSNTPIWVIVRDSNQNIRQECLQPDEQTGTMYTLYGVSASAHEAMTSAVKSHTLRPHRSPRGRGKG